MSDDIPTCGGHVEVRKRQAIRDQIPSGRENAADLRINDIPGRYFRPRTEPDDVRMVELDEDGSVYVGDIGSVRSVKALEPTRPADCYSAEYEPIPEPLDAENRNPRMAFAKNAFLEFGRKFATVANGHQGVIVEFTHPTLSFKPAEARRLARILTWQAESATEQPPNGGCGQ